MGACGCEEEYLGKLPAPEDNHWYVIGIYPGCQYCGDDWHLIILDIDETEDFPDYILEETKTIAFFDNYYPSWSSKILSVKNLKRRLEEYLDQEGRWGLDDFIRKGELCSVFYDTFILRRE